MDHPGTGITLRLEPYSASSPRRPDKNEKIPYERCNLHEGCISKMYDSIEGPYLELSELIPNSRSYIGSASIVEPEVIRKSVGKRPFYLLMVQRVYQKTWQEGDGKGWYDYMALVLQRTGKRDDGTVYRRVEMVKLKDTPPEEWFEGLQNRRITIVGICQHITIAEIPI